MPNKYAAHRKSFIAISVIAALPFSAVAQAEKNKSEEESIEVITVSGTRLQHLKSIDARRIAANVIDTTVASDIGQLPDFNIGEALQRLPGIGIKQDQAEARFVTVRALNAHYNYTTVDGVSIAVPDRNGRRVYMDVLPASLAERIDVYKTFNATNEGGAIGGIIDIRTASAFDKAREYLTADFQLGRYENDEGFRDVDPSGRGSVFFSNILGNNDQYGIVLTANYYKRDSTIAQTEWGSTKHFYNSDGTSAGKPANGEYPGNGYAVPGERRGFFYHNERNRYGVTAKFEYKHNDNTKYFIRTFWNTAVDDEARQTDLLRHSGAGTLVNQTATSGTLLDAKSFRQQHYLGQFDFKRSVWALTGGADYEFDDEAWLSIRLNYSGASFENEEDWAEWRLSGDNDDDSIVDVAFDYQLAGNVYHLTPIDDAYHNYSYYNADRRQFDERELNEDILEFKLDWSDTLNTSGSWSYFLGLAHREVDRDFDEERGRYKPTAANDYTLQNADVVNSDICLSAPGFLPSQCLLAIDPTRASRHFDAHLSANPDHWTFDELEKDDNNKDYGLKESVSAAYVMLQHNADEYDASFGVRYEKTNVDGTGRRNVSGTGWVDSSNSGGYSHLLPSAAINYHLADDVLLRAAFSKSLGRPSYDWIAPRNESFNPETLTLTRGNPALKARESTNLDLGIDWYFDDGQGLLGVNLFQKQIDGEFVSVTSSTTMSIDGTLEDVDVRQAGNDDRTITVNGLELQLVKNLDMIFKGLGISANATLLDTNQKRDGAGDVEYELLTMVEQPDESLNTALFYDSDSWSFRVAYHYQSISASHRLYSDYYRDRYDDARSTVDLKIGYQFSENVKAYVNLWNLTGEGRTELQGYNQEIPMVEADFGRAVFVGLSYKM